MWGTENGEADARRELEFAAFAPLSTFVPLSDTSVMGSVSEGDVDDAHAVASDHGDAAVRPIVSDHRDSDTVHGCVSVVTGVVKIWTTSSFLR